MKNWKKVLGLTAAVAMTATMMPTAVFADDADTFKIGVIGPMTGDYAQNFAKSDTENVKLAALRLRQSVFCINAKTCPLRTWTKLFRGDSTRRYSWKSYTGVLHLSHSAPYFIPGSGEAAGARAACQPLRGGWEKKTIDIKAEGCGSEYRALMRQPERRQEQQN